MRMWTGARIAVRKSTHLPEGAAHYDSFSSQAAREYSFEHTLFSRCALDHTSHALIAAWNTRRSCQKQIGTCGGKRALTTATHHPQASRETTSMHEEGSHPTRALSKSGSGMEANAFPCPARNEARVGIVKHFASIGGISQRLILTSSR